MFIGGEAVIMEERESERWVMEVVGRCGSHGLGLRTVREKEVMAAGWVDAAGLV